VLSDPETAIERLTTLRGFDSEDARARLAAQQGNDDRAALADRVIWNRGSLEALYAQIDEALSDQVRQ
jgi:dephospho-CoA kinase